jgi:hypothetical protein
MSSDEESLDGSIFSENLNTIIKRENFDLNLDDDSAVKKDSIESQPPMYINSISPIATKAVFEKDDNYNKIDATKRYKDSDNDINMNAKKIISDEKYTNEKQNSQTELSSLPMTEKLDEIVAHLGYFGVRINTSDDRSALKRIFPHFSIFNFAFIQRIKPRSREGSCGGMGSEYAASSLRAAGAVRAAAEVVRSHLSLVDQIRGRETFRLEKTQRLAIQAS